MRWATPWTFCGGWEVSHENGKTASGNHSGGELPGFEYSGRRGVFLNLGLDVEMDGVTYHLSSSFAEKAEMGEVIDRLELERNGRRTA